MTTFTSEDREMAAKHDGIKSPHNACCYREKCHKQADRIAELEKQLQESAMNCISAYAQADDHYTRVKELEKDIEDLKHDNGELLKSLHAEMKQSEPVAFRTHYPSGWEYKDGNPPFEMKSNQQLLYTTPQTKDKA